MTTPDPTAGNPANLAQWQQEISDSGLVAGSGSAQVMRIAPDGTESPVYRVYVAFAPGVADTAPEQTTFATGLATALSRYYS